MYGDPLLREEAPVPAAHRGPLLDGWLAEGLRKTKGAASLRVGILSLAGLAIGLTLLVLPAAASRSPTVIVTTIRTGGSPLGLAFGGGSLWVADNAKGQLIRVSPRTNRVVARLPILGMPFDVAFGAGAVWVGNETQPYVVRVDPTTNTVAARIKVGRRPLGIGYGAGSIWVTNETDATLSRIDPATNTVTTTIRLGGQPENIVVLGSTVFVTNRDGSIARVDAATNKLRRPLRIASDAHYLALAQGSLWVTTYNGSLLWRLDATTGVAQARIAVRSGGMGIASLKGVWLANWDFSTVTRVDPQRNRIVAILRVGRNPHDVTVGARSIWVASVGSGTVSRLTP